MNNNNDILFYKFKKEGNQQQCLLPADLTIEQYRPTFFKTNLHKSKHPINWMWFLLCNKNFHVFYVRNEENIIIHYSTVKPKFFKFPYLNDSDIEIGPCWTHKQYRGKGIYPAVLNYIVDKYKGLVTDFYMFTDKENIASQKGIEKAGFMKIGEGTKEGILGIYKIKNYYDR